MPHPDPDLDPVLVELVRDGVVESRHRGRVLVLDASGAVSLALGDVQALVLPRSASKPVQATAMHGLGLELEGELLALAAASHSGEPRHLDGVRRILASVGLSEDDLTCPAAWPLDEQVRLAYARRGLEPAPVAMNCSGKHAAMLATCRANGFSLDGILRPEHPLQQAVTATIEQLADERVRHVGTDGCGAPLHGLSLLGVARMYRTMALAPAGAPAAAVLGAMRAHPTWVSGTTREEARLMAVFPGLVLKLGAEGVFAGVLPDGRSFALKVSDGATRAASVLMAGVLTAMGLAHPLLHEVANPPVLGGGAVVGELRPLGGLPRC